MNCIYLYIYNYCCWRFLKHHIFIFLSKHSFCFSHQNHQIQNFVFSITVVKLKLLFSLHFPELICLHSVVFFCRCCWCRCKLSTSCLCCERVDCYPPLHLHTTEVLHSEWERSSTADRQSPLVCEPWNLSWDRPVCVWQQLNDARLSLPIPGRHEGKLHFTDQRHSDEGRRNLSLQNGNWQPCRTFYWEVRSESQSHW